MQDIASRGNRQQDLWELGSSIDALLVVAIPGRASHLMVPRGQVAEAGIDFWRLFIAHRFLPQLIGAAPPGAGLKILSQEPGKRLITHLRQQRQEPGAPLIHAVTSFAHLLYCLLH